MHKKNNSEYKFSMFDMKLYNYRKNVQLLIVVIFAFTLGACKSKNSNAKESINEGKMQNSSIPDSIVQFLLNSSASDFHNHPPSTSINFRSVKAGYLKKPNGETQFFLCGQFLTEENKEKNEWSYFSTIKTSGYEQYIGDQPPSACQNTNAIFDNENDLSSSLEKELNALR